MGIEGKQDLNGLPNPYIQIVLFARFLPSLNERFEIVGWC